ncbi:dynamin GTPase [Penicillium verhagenii]|nr:dynamin GTPase [Penicillium verhagenii]
MDIPYTAPPPSDSVLASLDRMTLDMRDLVRKVQKLSHLGIEDSKIALPKVCVVGDQSTGKSSLIEAISEIRVPRSAGTCTRCPMEIVLRESEPDQFWRCIISLVRGWWYDPQKTLKHMIPKDERSEYLGPWLRRDTQDEEEFVTLTDRSQVQDAIWWAQLAILNPTTDSQEYVPGKNENTSTNIEVKFSPNIVRLDISAPDFPNLSFYDLPGVINQPDHDDEKYLVTLVERLVKQYISQENCIVLLTLSMTDDASNSSAARIMRGVKGAKDRTLGVLTKPDRLAITDESYQQWAEILDGKKFHLGHGYYVVCNNPSPAVDHCIARQEEETFFGGPFWSSQMAAYQDRFGVRKLQAALSDVLMAQIQKCLPNIIKQIDEKAMRIDEELKTLPDPPADNLQRILIEKVLTLGLRFHGLFNDGAENRHLHQSWNNLILDFQKALEKTQPRIRLASVYDGAYFKERMDVDMEVPGAYSPRTKRKGAAVEENTPAAEPAAQQPAITRKVFLTNHFAKWEEPPRFELEDIRRIKQEYDRALGDVARDFVVALHRVVQKAIMMTLDEVMVLYHQTGLYRELQRIIGEYLDSIEAQFLDAVTAYFGMERVSTLTMAQMEHKERTNRSLKLLLERREAARAKCWQRVRGRPEEDYTKVTAADLGPDPFSQEIEMMANARGYYEIARMRFTDVVCLLAESKVRWKCRDELKLTLDAQINAATPERCSELMAEDPEREARRSHLSKQRKKLAQAQDWLSAVYQVDDDEDTEMPSDITMSEQEGLQDWDDNFAGSGLSI